MVNHLNSSIQISVFVIQMSTASVCMFNNNFSGRYLCAYADIAIVNLRQTEKYKFISRMSNDNCPYTTNVFERYASHLLCPQRVSQSLSSTLRIWQSLLFKMFERNQIGVDGQYIELFIHIVVFLINITLKISNKNVCIPSSNVYL